MLGWLGERIPQLFSAYGWMAALVVIVVLVLLATFVAWFLGVDVGELLSSVNWNGGGAA